MKGRFVRHKRNSGLGGTSSRSGSDGLNNGPWEDPWNNRLPETEIPKDYRGLYRVHIRGKCELCLVRELVHRFVKRSSEADLQDIKLS